MNSSDSSPRAVPSAPPSWVALTLWLLLCLLVGFLGGLASLDAREFYGALDRPSWAPPGYVFGPVWTVLYVLMAVAAWLVWRDRGWARARGALSLFVVQLVFNALWSWLFFAWRLGGWALVDIAIMWLLIAATLVAFARIRRLAAWLLVPYLAWVSFASVLNYSVWTRNPTLL